MNDERGRGGGRTGGSTYVSGHLQVLNQRIV